MKVETVAVESLIAYERNNLKHPQSQVDRLANSIAEFGFNVPIVVNEQNVIIAGHGRLLAAKKLGMTEVPVVRKDNLTPAQERAYRLIDNGVARQGEWDIEALNIEGDILKDDGFDFASWGLETLVPNLIEPPEFQPVSIDEQGKLDEKKKTMCPNCGHEFDPK